MDYCGTVWLSVLGLFVADILAVVLVLISWVLCRAAFAAEGMGAVLSFEDDEEIPLCI